MKKTISIAAVVLVLAAAVTAFIVIANNPEKRIIGKWSDSDGSSGYQFYEDGKVTMTYANFTIPIINIPFQGDVEGTYKINKKDETITLTGKFFTQTVNIVYTYSFKGNNLTLTNTQSRKAITYIKQEDTTK